MKCQGCHKELTGKQTKWCSHKCKCECSNNKNQSYKAQQTRGLKRKKEILLLKGGCCKHCGYKKSLAALSFHHRNPEEKSFNLDLRSLSNRKWESILLELDKCDLLCANCHMEEHYGCEW
jgi:hypothetical protein